MENYKANRKYLGESDIASLVAVGCDSCGVKSEIVKMGCDGGYSAYIIPSEMEVPSHYTLTNEFENWMKIYDDSGLVFVCYSRCYGGKIKIYRAGSRGIIIQY